MNKQNIINRINESIKNGEAIIVAGVGSGVTAKAASKGGADLIATYNTAVYRIQGIPTAMAFLPYDDCNSLTLKVAPEVIVNAGDTPVLLGLGAHDPRRDLEGLVEQAVQLGAIGITNEPFIGMYEGDIKNQIEATGFGFKREKELIEISSRKGLLTLGYAFTPKEAVEMVNAGADLIGAMVGGVTSGGVAGGAETISIDGAIESINEIVNAINKSGRNVPVLVHGGPLNDQEAVSKALNKTGAAGYITGSTGERIPIEDSVKNTIKGYKSIRREIYSE